MPPIQRPPFVPFDENKAIRVYQRNLPHWRQEGATYFVTFRPGDSIPDDVRREWDYEQRTWLAARGIDYDGQQGTWRPALERLPASDRFQFERHFNRKVQACLDRGYGACHLQRRDCIRKVREKLLADDGARHHLGDFVVITWSHFRPFLPGTRMRAGAGRAADSAAGDPGKPVRPGPAWLRVPEYQRTTHTGVILWPYCESYSGWTVGRGGLVRAGVRGES